jgi:hypothetical protein
MADWYYVSTTFPYPLLWRFFLSIFFKAERDTAKGGFKKDQAVLFLFGFYLFFLRLF